MPPDVRCRNSACYFDLWECTDIKRSWIVRKYRKGDEEEIIELLNRVFKKWHSLEYWKWKYMKNPAGSPIIFLAEHNGRIIGHYGIIPIRMKVGNIYTTGSFSCDGAVHPDYQDRGVFSSIVSRCYLEAAEKNLPLTYGLANVNLGPIYKRYEWRGHVCFMVHLRRDHARKTLQHKTSEGSLKVEEISRFDDGIDKFWEQVSGNFKIIVVRDQRHLNWKYVDHPENKYAILIAVRDHRIRGYCVLNEVYWKYPDCPEKENLRVGFIVDILGFQDGYDVVGCLVQRALERFEEHDISAINCMVSERHPYRTVLRKAGFIMLPNPNRALFATINLRGSSINEKETYSQALMLSQSHFLKDKRNWFMTSGDGDSRAS